MLSAFTSKQTSFEHKSLCTQPSWVGMVLAQPSLVSELKVIQGHGAHHCGVKQISWADGDAVKVNGVNVL